MQPRNEPYTPCHSDRESDQQRRLQEIRAKLQPSYRDTAAPGVRAAAPAVTGTPSSEVKPEERFQAELSRQWPDRPTVPREQTEYYNPLQGPEAFPPWASPEHQDPTSSEQKVLRDLLGPETPTPFGPSPDRLTPPPPSVAMPVASGAEDSVDFDGSSPVNSETSASHPETEAVATSPTDQAVVVPAIQQFTAILAPTPEDEGVFHTPRSEGGADVSQRPPYLPSEGDVACEHPHPASLENPGTDEEATEEVPSFEAVTGEPVRPEPVEEPATEEPVKLEPVEEPAEVPAAPTSPSPSGAKRKRSRRKRTFGVTGSPATPTWTATITAENSGARDGSDEAPENLAVPLVHRKRTRRVRRRRNEFSIQRRFSSSGSSNTQSLVGSPSAR